MRIYVESIELYEETYSGEDLEELTAFGNRTPLVSGSSRIQGTLKVKKVEISGEIASGDSKVSVSYGRPISLGANLESSNSTVTFRTRENIEAKASLSSSGSRLRVSIPIVKDYTRTELRSGQKTLEWLTKNLNRISGALRSKYPQVDLGDDPQMHTPLDMNSERLRNIAQTPLYPGPDFPNEDWCKYLDNLLTLEQGESERSLVACAFRAKVQEEEQIKDYAPGWCEQWRLTSVPYPIDAVEAVESSASFRDSIIWGIEPEEIQSTASFLDGELRDPIVVLEIPPEDIESTASFLDGELEVWDPFHRYDHTDSPEKIESSAEFLDGTIKQVLIVYDHLTDPEEIESTAEFLDGTLEQP